jgi:phosphoenolpyruvate carboxylase
MIDTDRALERVAAALATSDETVLRETVEDLFPQMLNEISVLRNTNNFLEIQVTELETRLKEFEE